MKNTEWELHHHCLQVRPPKRERKVAVGAGHADKGDLVITDQVRSTKHARCLGTTKVNGVLRQQPVGRGSRKESP
jgi:hypothetical protein